VHLSEQFHHVAHTTTVNFILLLAALNLRESRREQQPNGPTLDLLRSQSDWRPHGPSANKLSSADIRSAYAAQYVAADHESGEPEVRPSVLCVTTR
jgi:hypothetical protein